MTAYAKKENTSNHVAAIASFLQKEARPYSGIYLPETYNINELAASIMSEIIKYSETHPVLMVDTTTGFVAEKSMKDAVSQIYKTELKQYLVLNIKLGDLEAVGKRLGKRSIEDVMAAVARVARKLIIKGDLAFRSGRCAVSLFLSLTDAKTAVRAKKIASSVASTMVPTCGHLVTINAETSVKPIASLDEALKCLF